MKYTYLKGIKSRLLIGFIVVLLIFIGLGLIPEKMSTLKCPDLGCIRWSNLFRDFFHPAVDYFATAPIYFIFKFNQSERL